MSKFDWTEKPDFSAWPEEKLILFDWRLSMDEIKKKYKNHHKRFEDIDDSYIEKRIEARNKLLKKHSPYIGEPIAPKFEIPPPLPPSDHYFNFHIEDN